MPQLISTSSAHFQSELADVLKGPPPAILCGSAISRYYPTLLQGGHQTSEAIADVLCTISELQDLCHATKTRPRLFKKAITEAAYEALLQQYPRRELLPAMFQNYFLRHSEPVGGNNVKFNSMHQALARLLANDAARAIVTTNYDTCIEDAFPEEMGKPSVIVKKTDPVGRYPIFKIHGCARQSKTMIFSLDQEGEMRKWKRNRLQRLVRDDHLVVISYSGLDFEVCPEIYDLGLKRITWVAREFQGKPELTTNARKVLRQASTESVVISGDMNAFLATWGGAETCSKPECKRLSDQIFDVLSDREKRLWAARTFVVLSIPSAAAAAVKAEERALLPMEPLPAAFKEVELGILNHSMRYFDNADRNAAFARDEKRRLLLRIQSAIGESGSSSMAGDNERMASALEYARLLAATMKPSKEKDRMALDLEWMRLLSLKTGLRRTDKKAVRSFVEELRVLQTRSYQHAKHHLIDLCEQEINQITGVRQKRPDKGMQKRSGQIFKQLGNYVGQVTALHTQAAKTKKPSFLKKLERRTIVMKIYGLPPWRLYQTMIELERERNRRQLLFSAFSESIAACQFEGSYKTAMIAQAVAALENPHVLR